MLEREDKLIPDMYMINMINGYILFSGIIDEPIGYEDIDGQLLVCTTTMCPQNTMCP